jgi:septal ring factor EnvC (AmiA/AmiB activator)
VKDIASLAGDVSELQDDVAQVKETLTVHETRFGNGREVMATLRSEVEALKPKAPDWLKLMLAGLSVVGILMGAQLWLTEKFNDRPTQDEVEKMAAPLKQAQKETAKEIGDIEKSQSAQQTSIRNIEREQTKQGGKIDQILDRLPKRRTNR